MCWEGLGAAGEGEDRGWDGRMASLTRWTWVSVNSGSWWWTGRPGVLRFTGSQRVRHDWATDLIWSEVQSIDIPERINHFNLWPILFLVICIVDMKLYKLFVCFGDESLVDIFFGKLFPYSEDCPCLSWGFPLGLQMLLIQSQYLICGLFFIILRGGPIKNLLHFMSDCVLFIFFSIIS